MNCLGNITALVIILFFCSSCLPIGSTVKINGGSVSFNETYVQPLLNHTDGSRYCSAVFVTPKIALSAAHCFEGSNAQPPIVITDSGLHHAKKVVMPQKYFASANLENEKKENSPNPNPAPRSRPDDGGTVINPIKILPNENKKQDVLPQPKKPKYAYDLAVVYFESNVVEKTIKLSTAAIMNPENDNGTLHTLGFGCNRHLERYLNLNSGLQQAYGRGLIRWKSPEPMKLEKLEHTGTPEANAYVVTGVLSTENEKFNVAVCPGDSGGALLKNDELIGITSRVDNFYNGTNSLFTSLNHPFAKSFIASALSPQKKNNMKMRVVNRPKEYTISEDYRKLLMAQYLENQKFLLTHKNDVESTLLNIEKLIEKEVIQRKIRRKIMVKEVTKYRYIVDRLKELSDGTKESPLIFPLVFKKTDHSFNLAEVGNIGRAVLGCSLATQVVRYRTAAPIQREGPSFNQLCHDAPKLNWIRNFDYEIYGDGRTLRIITLGAMEGGLPVWPIHQKGAPISGPAKDFRPTLIDPKAGPNMRVLHESAFAKDNPNIAQVITASIQRLGVKGLVILPLVSIIPTAIQKEYPTMASLKVLFIKEGKVIQHKEWAIPEHQNAGQNK